MRKLRYCELGFIKKMIEDCHFDKSTFEKIDQVLVEEMNDGGMGSLLFFSSKAGRVIGREVARREFVDEDGVPVVAILSLDNYGDLYELDVWKTNFSKLIKFPRRQ